MVMLKALIQYQEATADPRVIPMMTHYFKYQLANFRLGRLHHGVDSAGRTSCLPFYGYTTGPRTRHFWTS